jgi:hypothetical protein
MGQDEFDAAMLERYELWRDQIGYRATRYLQMVRRRGGVESAHLLLAKKGVSQGFLAIAEARRLDLTVEWLVLQARYAALFSSQELDIARERLTRYGASAASLPS